MLCGGSRVSLHLWDRRQSMLGLGLGFCGAKIVQLSSFVLRPPTTLASAGFGHRLQHRIVSSSGPHCKTPGEVPVLHDCFSQQEDDHDLQDEGLSSPVAGGIVALGKFDALHLGHRELAIQASRIGTPYLLSFVGMAEVLGWEPRDPIVAKCDRKRVLSSWTSYCGNITPQEFQIEFSSVRHLSPREFVEKLSKELRVSGVVAGENYRFGYRASGDTAELVRLCEEYGIGAYVIDSVMDKNRRSPDSQTEGDRGQVSSTRVRQALAMGDMEHVTELLGRPHRLVLSVGTRDLLPCDGGRRVVSAPRSSVLNLPPRNGVYEACSVLVNNGESPISCRVVVDRVSVHIETGEPLQLSDSSDGGAPEFQLLGIEFG
ncbi:PREDICTED: FAD synthetase 2, chloroplastic-like isoform X1 [Tarenaya hassleriana]|uniref:FAD synthetase 2, chloroplastic-like isoform X2 n=1 Tax=Tarenaya hassleriana TaxID=28532 RepID=UPI00053C69E4|nr:PREDICTED: FAD synthetase 2, chloroplastic-like isoform X2 [Tarenaya hassleriana]XP_019058635.1 PREDICTED: FAD synthetase 2, chloroplastic-like isoform X1 [Tarenaya hassleriana]